MLSTYVFTEVSSLNNNGDVGQGALAQNLEITQLSHIDDGGKAGRVGFGLVKDTLGHKAPKAVNVKGGAVVLAALQVEVAHAHLTKVTRVELIHQDSVVVLTTSVTTTSRMAPVLTDTTVTGTHVSSFLSVVVKSGRLLERTKQNN